MLVNKGDDLIDVVNRYTGQGVLNLLALDGVKQQVDAAIVQLRPDTEADGAQPAGGVTAAGHAVGG